VIELQLGSGVRVHSKVTLLGSTVLRGMLSSELLATMDDAVGMIDFEIGSRADRFIGAPFSSFSVMIALKRARRQLPEPPGSRYDVTLAPDEHSPGTLMAAGAPTRPTSSRPTSPSPSRLPPRSPKTRARSSWRCTRRSPRRGSRAARCGP